MKRCPQCGREYDNTMMFCLDDGTELLYGPASTDGPQTAILSDRAASVGGQFAGENPTRQFTQTTAAAEPQKSISEPSEKQSFSAHRAVKPLLGVLAILVVVLGGLFGYRYFSSEKQISSIAVMPFANESGNPDLEYLSDGMTETLIKSLANMPDMDVKPRSTVFRYKGKDIDPATVGKELNVQSILDGRVTQRGDLLTLTLELVDVRKNSVIWAEQYQRPQADIIVLQSEIAKDISAKLSPQLSSGDETKVSKQATADPEAYQAYLRGRYYWNKRTGEDMYKAIEQFQIAIGHDPNYALALSGLADAYSLLPDYAMNAPSDSMDRAEDSARRAIAADVHLAEPHGTLGNIFYYHRQWAEAEAEYKRVIEINPNYATGYHWYSVLLYGLGRNDEAAAMITRAHELDPMSNIIGQNYAQMYRFKGDYQASIDICKKIIELDPSFPGGHFAMAWSFLKTGRNQEAIAEFQKAAELNGRHSNSLGELGFALAASGRLVEARELIKELEEKFQQNRALGMDIASIYAALGDKDKAFEWIGKDLSAGSARLAEFRWSPASEPLRDDPRFKDMLKRMNLPE